jgi:hypothetical protein
MRFLSALILATLAGCGGGTSPAPSAPAEAREPPRVLVVGGNEVFERQFPSCVTNAGVEDGNSTSVLGLFSLGVLNNNPSAVVIVANAYELESAGAGWAELGYTPDQIAEIVSDAHAVALDNYMGATLHAVVSGARVTLVGVPGAVEFNASLRGLATAYGAAYADALDTPRCAP